MASGVSLFPTLRSFAGRWKRRILGGPETRRAAYKRVWNAQAGSEVVVQHEGPAAEHLFGQEFGKADEFVAHAARAPHVVVSVAVQHERRCRAREVELGQLLCPGREGRG